MRKLHARLWRNYLLVGLFFIQISYLVIKADLNITEVPHVEAVGLTKVFTSFLLRFK